MRYVSLLQSESEPARRCVGATARLRGRIAEHNTGKAQTIARHLPLRLLAYIAFPDERIADECERYLKSGFCHTFAKRHRLERPKRGKRKCASHATARGALDVEFVDSH